MRLSANELNATTWPSPLTTVIAGLKAPDVPSPAREALARRTSPVWRSFTQTCGTPVGLAPKFRAFEVKATYRPSLLTEGELLSAPVRAGPPSMARLTQVRLRGDAALASVEPRRDRKSARKTRERMAGCRQRDRRQLAGRVSVIGATAGTPSYTVTDRAHLLPPREA